jgi:hypothetical protein
LYQRITELAAHSMRRAASLSDKPDFSSANARRRRSERRSALPLGLGTGIHLRYQLCIIYTEVKKVSSPRRVVHPKPD